MEAGSQRNLLPVVGNASPTPVTRSRLRGIVFHGLRIAVLVAIVWLIREQHRAFVREQAGRDAAPIPVERLRKYYPNVASVAGETGAQRTTNVLDGEGQPLGYFIQTSPESDRVTGYSGPTNTLIAFDAESRVIGIEILDSRDTPEHVADVRRDDLFMTALAGKTWDEVRASTDIDTVSGATLTSLAILEGINYRLGGNQPSLRFPDEITLAEAVEHFPQATALRPRSSSTMLHDVYDTNDTALGAVMRTSPATDSIMGYQGPTDSLVVFDQQDRVIGLQIRESYDNQPYVGYIRDETYFRERFNGLTVHELANLDIDAFEVEGVSGATMTSKAIANGLPHAAHAALEPPPITKRRVVFATRDIGTLLVLIAAIAISFSPLRSYRSLHQLSTKVMLSQQDSSDQRKRVVNDRAVARIGCGPAALRIAYQLMLVGYFGFMNGDMLSQALLAGWAQSGAAWRLAPGLMLLVAASLIVPAVSKKQLYCHHICPFGAAQQLIRNRLPWKVSLPRRLAALLEMIPAILLAVALLTAMLHWPVNLAGIEPFDAFFLVGSASMAIAVGGLVVSAFVPMAYCRFGCPTGALLNHLRYNARSDRLTRRDAIAVALLVLAAGL